MGATYSVLNIKLTQKSLAIISVADVTGQMHQQAFLQFLECQLWNLKLSPSFLYMLESSIPLLGWDLFCKLHAQVTFSPEKQQLHLQVPPKHAL